MADEILTLENVANYLKLKEKIACRLAAESKPTAYKVGRSWRFKKKWPAGVDE